MPKMRPSFLRWDVHIQAISVLNGSVLSSVIYGHFWMRFASLQNVAGVIAVHTDSEWIKILKYTWLYHFHS